MIETNERLKVPLEIPFQQTFVLNWGRSTSSYASFLDANQWHPHQSKLQLVPVLHSSRVRPPLNWGGSKQSWAWLRALTHIFESCLFSGIPSGMVVDDRARLVDQSQERLKDFHEQLPNDWRLIVLGAELARTTEGVPIRVAESVFRPYSLQSCLAFAWRGFPTLQRLYHHCLSQMAQFGSRQGLFDVEGVSLPFTYVPGSWIFIPKSVDSPRVSELRGVATPVAGKTVNEGTKPSAAIGREPLDATTLTERPVTRPIVSVLGCYRGGSSWTAGVLHKLGVSMGTELARDDFMNPNGYFECRRLLGLSRRMVDHPSMARAMEKDQIVGLLKQWALWRIEQEQGSFVGGAPIGAKHPMLCCLGEEVLQAWPMNRFVVVDRDPDEIVSSILRTTWGWGLHEARLNVQTVVSQRESFINLHPEQSFHRIDFAELRSAPRRVIEQLCVELSLPIVGPRFESAVQHVKRIDST